MKLPYSVPCLLLATLACTPLFSQEPVTPAPNPDALFHSKDKKLDANKQVVYHIERDLLEANHWDQASKYLTDEYLQHNPNVVSGLKPVLAYFSRRTPSPIPEHMKTKVVAVTAEGDLVTVATVAERKDPKDPSKTYTTTWFDMWRIKNGKADEHWDCALKP